MKDKNMEQYEICYVTKFNTWLIGRPSGEPIAASYKEENARMIADALNYAQLTQMKTVQTKPGS